MRSRAGRPSGGVSHRLRRRHRSASVVRTRPGQSLGRRRSSSRPTRPGRPSRIPSSMPDEPTRAPRAPSIRIRSWTSSPMSSATRPTGSSISRTSTSASASCPRSAGRIFEAVDKTNGYDFVYRQHVIKPALIGMLGAWISGGVEWNVPHHHRATTFMPVDSTDRDRPRRQRDGLGRRDRAPPPDEVAGRADPASRIDRPRSDRTKIFNRTPCAHSMLSFANVAVHANESYQVIFPPSTEIATFHGKNQFSRWPVSTEVFNGQDYTKGVDVSWWKNHPTPDLVLRLRRRGGFPRRATTTAARPASSSSATTTSSPARSSGPGATGSEGKTWERRMRIRPRPGPRAIPLL